VHRNNEIRRLPNNACILLLYQHKTKLTLTIFTGSMTLSGQWTYANNNRRVNYCSVKNGLTMGPKASGSRTKCNVTVMLIMESVPKNSSNQTVRKRMISLNSTSWFALSADLEQLNSLTVSQPFLSGQVILRVHNLTELFLF